MMAIDPKTRTATKLLSILIKDLLLPSQMMGFSLHSQYTEIPGPQTYKANLSTYSFVRLKGIGGKRKTPRNSRCFQMFTQNIQALRKIISQLNRH